MDKFLLRWGSANKNSYELVQTISHNLQYKIEKTHFNFDTVDISSVYPYIWISGNYGQVSTLMRLCKQELLHIIYITKWRKPFGILIDTSLLYQ